MSELYKNQYNSQQIHKVILESNKNSHVIRALPFILSIKLLDTWTINQVLTFVHLITVERGVWAPFLEHTTDVMIHDILFLNINHTYTYKLFILSI